MARPLRIEYDGAVYHVTSRGNKRESIFYDDMDRTRFLDVLHRVNRRYNFHCHAYCLMSNHYHLLLETPDGNLSKGMRQLNGVYSLGFNKRHKTVGHVMQGRFKAILIQRESHLLEVCRYVVLNPVRAKMVERPDEWKWSSYSPTAGLEKSHPCLERDWILGQFAGRKRTAEDKYKEFVGAGIGKNNMWRDVKGQSLLGKEEFVEGLIGYVKGYEDVNEIPKSQRYINRKELSTLLSGDVILDKKIRNTSMVEAVNKHGYSQKEIAEHLGMHYTSISRILSKTLKVKA